jgi:glycosyltransferase involved in cell wall biosynthesis
MRILQLTSYPTCNPLHGGQIRCHNIATELRRAGHEVTSLAVYSGWNYQEIGDEDIAFEQSSIFYNHSYPWLSDYYSGLFAANDLKALGTLEKKVASFSPDCIVIEQPWLYKAARSVAKNNTKLVYSSQNIEWRLKGAMFQSSDKAEQELLQLIEATEIEAVKGSDLTSACTEGDASYYEQFIDVSKQKIIVAGNGVEPFSCDDNKVHGFRGYINGLCKHIRKPYPVFVSGAHPPNAQGFWDMMAPGLTFLKPMEKLYVIGGVCSILRNFEGISAFKSINRRHLKLLGMQEKLELQTIVKESHVVILPITVGEGSNLKTAEAIESGRPIVGTSKAFRGFEAAMTLPHVTIADTPEDFRTAVRRVLDAPRYLGGTPSDIRSQYYWSQQLRPLVDAISNLVT